MTYFFGFLSLLESLYLPVSVPLLSRLAQVVVQPGAVLVEGPVYGDSLPRHVRGAQVLVLHQDARVGIAARTPNLALLDQCSKLPNLEKKSHEVYM